MLYDEVEHFHPPAMGNRIEVFRPSSANIVAGYILSSLALGGAVAIVFFTIRGAAAEGWHLPIYVKKGWSWVSLGLGWFCALLCAGTGFSFALFARVFGSSRVDVFEEGFRSHSRNSFEDVPWERVDRIEETILTELSPILHFPLNLLLPRTVSHSYQIFTTDGRNFIFDGNSIKLIKKFGSHLRSEADRLSLTWETVEEHN